MRILLNVVSLTFVFITVFSCSTLKKQPEQIQTATFLIEVIQEGKVIKPIENKIRLRKKPFMFKVTLFGIDAVSVSAAWNNKLYNFPQNKNIYFCNNENKYENCGFFSPMTMATDSYNTNKKLIVGNEEAQQHWFFDKDGSWHRFDEGVSIEAGKITATFTVENISDWMVRDSEDTEVKKVFSIEEINRDIYLVFASSQFNKEKKYYTELQREKFILEFED